MSYTFNGTNNKQYGSTVGSLTHSGNWRFDLNLDRNSGGASVALDMQGAIVAARGGEEWAFSFLANYYRGTAERVAQHILRTEEAAADAVQEALIKVHRAMPRFQDGNFRSWLLRIVTNTCYDHLRRQKRRAAISLDELTEQSGGEFVTPNTTDRNDPESIVLHSETMERLLRVIDELPPWHRNVVLMVDVHGYDYSEAAEALGLPLGTIKSRLSRARASLRDQLLREGLVPLHLIPMNIGREN